MKKMIAITMILFYSTTVYAVTNIWSSLRSEGATDYEITNELGYLLVLSCSNTISEYYNQGGMDHVLLIFKGGERVRGYIDFSFNGEIFPVPNKTDYREGAMIWDALMMKLKEAAPFKLYLNNEPVGEFVPSKQNVQQVLTKPFCPAMYQKK